MGGERLFECEENYGLILRNTQVRLVGDEISRGSMSSHGPHSAKGQMVRLKLLQALRLSLNYDLSDMGFCAGTVPDRRTQRDA